MSTEQTQAVQHKRRTRLLVKHVLSHSEGNCCTSFLGFFFYPLYNSFWQQAPAGSLNIWVSCLFEEVLYMFSASYQNGHVSVRGKKKGWDWTEGIYFWITHVGNEASKFELRCRDTLALCTGLRTWIWWFRMSIAKNPMKLKLSANLRNPRFSSQPV